MHVYDKMHTKGFTIIEVVVIISVISVLALFANMVWPGLAINANAQAEQLASDLRYTQALSMTQGQRYCLKISSNTYQILISATNTALILALGNTTVTLNSGISFGTIAPSGAVMFVFDGNGTPYTSTATTCTTANAAAATALSANATIPIIASGQTRTVVISPETGSITTQ